MKTMMENMMTTRGTHRNRMHVYFKIFLTKKVDWRSPTLIQNQEQWIDLFASEAFVKMTDVLQHQCEAQGRSYIDIDVYIEILGKKSGYVSWIGHTIKHIPTPVLVTQSSDLQIQLEKATDKIDPMGATREKDLEDWGTKQAEMEVTLHEQREE
ncbi:hypothetical protein CJ030_MR7G001545 [Morella rubra]|uniref:Uncharacterized protein n=1 Tax=Morella rubra TaxID=262757 RepID=A0A6A1V1W9_9ROSI|nr:hypothetical protein CJ030_MR7G001551 [Morella rubra]KAB1206641.1 hypothetical protein CJ030_MR7G001545 [Morella rubra]